MLKRRKKRKPCVHPNGFWLHATGNDHKFDAGLAVALSTLFAGSTVLDLGCGPGAYVRAFRARGIVATGVDGNPLSKEYDPSIHIADLASPCSFDTADWVLSLEVGEHIPAHHEAAFLANVCRHCRTGVILSWALPGQGGLGHVNERSNEYVAARMPDFDRLHTLERRLREASTLPWFAGTVMAFGRRTLAQPVAAG